MLWSRRRTGHPLRWAWVLGAVAAGCGPCPAVRSLSPDADLAEEDAGADAGAGPADSGHAAPDGGVEGGSDSGCPAGELPTHWYLDIDGDGRGEGTAELRCGPPDSGYAPQGGDNCPFVPNPDQADIDQDGLGDVCVAVGGCSELTETNLLARWTPRAGDGAPTTLRVLEGDAGVAEGARALRAATDSGYDFALRFDSPPGRPLDVSAFDRLRWATRASNSNDFGWQGNFPVVVLEDTAGRTRALTPAFGQLPSDGTSWLASEVPLAGGRGWTALEKDGGVDLSHLAALEFHADTWGFGFTWDLDAVVFDSAATRCPLACPKACTSHGACDVATLTCRCELGYAGTACEECAPGFALNGKLCKLAVDGTFTEWPNPVSTQNSDPWLVVHHQEVQTLRPKVLVLNFVNPSDPATVGNLVDRVVLGFREGSKHQGFRDAGAPVQLEFTLARPIVDLRDGVLGRPPPPIGYPYENSTLYPRRPPSQPGDWRFDYAALFDAGFAPNLGFLDPQDAGSFLDLCTLVEQGKVHEVWVVGSGDVPDVSAAEVLGAQPQYDSNRNRLQGPMNRCAGNGCFDPDVPNCGRTLRVGFVNYHRGPGCYLHSHGHGLEHIALLGLVPPLTEWFVPFGGFDLAQRFGAPVFSWYQVDCPTKPCLSFPTPTSVQINFQGVTSTVSPFDAVCGNVHFPPNGRDHYDYADVAQVSSSCEGFGRHRGANGLDALTTVGTSNWSPFSSVTGDCGGEFLVWWYQNMPGYASGQTHTDGGAMLSVWPFFYY